MKNLEALETLNCFSLYPHTSLVSPTGFFQEKYDSIELDPILGLMLYVNISYDWGQILNILGYLIYTSK